MAHYVMIMAGSAPDGDWDGYIAKLISNGNFRGGSSLGNGARVSKDDPNQPCTVHGYIRFTADSLDEARRLLDGNPVYEAGLTVELLEEIPE